MNFINIIKKDKNIRKIFGKREIIIIEKQLMGVQLKPSEKTRLSRDIRKKFEAIKTLSQFSDMFELKHRAIIKNLIEDAKEVILEDISFKNIKKIILFGSAVENQLTFRSDIDIAIEFFDINVKEATAFRIRISGKVDKKIDIQVYNILPDKIKKEIDKKGKVIYERED